MTKRQNRTAGLLLATMTLWSVGAYASVQVCPVHDAPEGVEQLVHGSTDEHGPADEHDGHDCQCAGHCCPASGETITIGDSGLTLALVESGLVTTSTDYDQPSAVSHPWMLPPANGPPVA